LVTLLTFQLGIGVAVAERLLENESRSLDEITYQMGYEDSSTLTVAARNKIAPGSE
jgi:hypothetical protein